MDYDDPYGKSESEMQLLTDLVNEIILQIDLADEYYSMAIDLRVGSQEKIATQGTMMNDSDMVSNLSMWYGAGYMIQLLGEYGICRHELKRFDCGICSRNVLVQRER
jgi:hypothetical protein